MACESTPPVRTADIKQQLESDRAAGQKVGKAFERSLPMVRERDIEKYLAGLADRLRSKARIQYLGPLSARVVGRDRGKVQNFALPGTRIYLSRNFLRRVQFENVLAAALTLQMAHIRMRHYEGKLSTEGNSDGSWFEYSEQQYEEAIQLAVGMLYESGYDVRGLVTYWQILSEISEHPFDEVSIDKLTIWTRREIVRYSPLRNPVVRSNSFIAIQQRFGSL